MATSDGDERWRRAMAANAVEREDDIQDDACVTHVKDDVTVLEQDDIQWRLGNVVERARRV